MAWLQRHSTDASDWILLAILVSAWGHRAAYFAHTRGYDLGYERGREDGQRVAAGKLPRWEPIKIIEEP